MLERATPIPGLAGVGELGRGLGDRPGRRRRRPSGEPPPLPREDRWTRWIWALAAVLLLGAVLNVLIHTTGAAILAPSVADVTFQWLVPEEGFPISYRKRATPPTWTSAVSAGRRSSGPWSTSSA